MPRKLYTAPILLASGGDIDINDSQEGAIGGGDVADDILAALAEMGIDESMIYLAGLDPADVGSWNIEGFDPNDSGTWDLAVDYILSHI